METVACVKPHPSQEKNSVSITCYSNKSGVRASLRRFGKSAGKARLCRSCFGRNWNIQEQWGKFKDLR